MMHYQLDKQRSESAYMRIYRQLREEIISGTLKAGTKLPSKRALAEELNVSVITVEHAYALLIDEGYVLSKPRSGLYASFGSGTSAPSARRVAALQCGGNLLHHVVFVQLVHLAGKNLYEFIGVVFPYVLHQRHNAVAEHREAAVAVGKLRRQCEA